MDLKKYQAGYAELSKFQATKNLHYYERPSLYYITPFRIAGNLYYVGDKKVCSHLVDTGDGLILFDTGFPHTTHMQVQAIWELGFNPKDIKLIIHSHEHFDHIGAAVNFKDQYGCKLAISQKGAETMEKYPERLHKEASPFPFPTFVPDQKLCDGEKISIGSTTIRCVETPGHSDGVMTFFFDVQDEDKTYRAGYFGGVGFNTLYKMALKESGRSLSAREEFLASLRKVRNEKVDINMGNHPLQNDTLNKREKMLEDPTVNPFINSQEWGENIDTLISEFLSFMENDNEE